MQVVLGGVDLEKDEIYDQVIPVEKAVVHEDYRETPFVLYNDIGVEQKLLHRKIVLMIFGHTTMRVKRICTLLMHRSLLCASPVQPCFS